jgi:c-di-AMP phosphodiesterase-like protein
MKRENWQSKIPSFLLKPVIIWPLVITLLFLLIIIGISASVSIQMGFIIGILTTVVIGLLIFSLIQMFNALKEYILGLGNQIKSVQSEILLKMPIGIIVFDEEEPTIEWVNPFLQKYFYQKEIIGLNIGDLDEEIFELYQEFQEDPLLKSKRFQWQNAHFEVTYLRNERALYFIDTTKYGIIAENADLGRIVIGHIVIDNYDETVSSMNDRRKSTIDNLVTSDLSKWAKEYDSYIKRLDDDHFLLVSTYGQLSRMEENKFVVVDHLREKTSKANTPLTISMGISYQEKEDIIDVDDISEQGQSNLDLAHSRGGDQVVVRTKNQKAR